MYRLDHQAFRTLDRAKCVKFFMEILGYNYADEFPIRFEGEKIPTICSILTPGNRVVNAPWTIQHPWHEQTQEYVLDHEVFVSEGPPGSIVHEWAKKHGGGGLHHCALQIPASSTVEQEMTKWLALGWSEGFSTEAPIVCDELVQIFTKPSQITGLVFELIERKEAGFCRASVQKLMISTKGD